MVFARFHLNGPKASAPTMPVHISGSESDDVTVFPSHAICCNCRMSFIPFKMPFQAASVERAGSYKLSFASTDHTIRAFLFASATAAIFG